MNKAFRKGRKKAVKSEQAREEAFLDGLDRAIKKSIESASRNYEIAKRYNL